MDYTPPRTIEHHNNRSNRRDTHHQRKPSRVRIFDDQDEIFIDLNSIVELAASDSIEYETPVDQPIPPKPVASEHETVFGLPDGFPSVERLDRIFRSNDPVTVRSVGTNAIRLLCQYLPLYPKVLSMFFRFYPLILNATLPIRKDSGTLEGWAVQLPDLLYECYAPTARNRAGPLFHVLFNLMTRSFQYSVPVLALSDITQGFLQVAIAQSLHHIPQHVQQLFLSQDRVFLTATLWKHALSSLTSPYFFGKAISIAQTPPTGGVSSPDDTQTSPPGDITGSVYDMVWGVEHPTPPTLTDLETNFDTAAHGFISHLHRRRETATPEAALDDPIPTEIPKQRPPTPARIPLRIDTNPLELPEHSPVPTQIPARAVFGSSAAANPSPSALSTIAPVSIDHPYIRHLRINVTMQDLFFHHLLLSPITIGDRLPAKHPFYQRYALLLANLTNFFVNGGTIQPQAYGFLSTALHLWFDVHQYTPRVELVRDNDHSIPPPAPFHPIPPSLPATALSQHSTITPSFFAAQSIYSMISTIIASPSVHAQYCRIPLHPMVPREVAAVEAHFNARMPSRVNEPTPVVSHMAYVPQPQGQSSIGFSGPSLGLAHTTITNMAASDTPATLSPSPHGRHGGAYVHAQAHNPTFSLQQQQPQHTFSVGNPMSSSSAAMGGPNRWVSIQGASQLTDTERARLVLRSLSSYHAECAACDTVPYIRSPLLISLAHGASLSAVIRNTLPAVLHDVTDAASSTHPSFSSVRPHSPLHHSSHGGAKSLISRDSLTNLVYHTALHSPVLAVSRMLPPHCAILLKPLYNLTSSILADYSTITGRFYTQRVDTLLLSWWTWIQPWQCLPQATPYKQVIDPATSLVRVVPSFQQTAPQRPQNQSQSTTSNDSLLGHIINNVSDTLTSLISNYLPPETKPAAPLSPPSPPPSDRLLVNYAPWIIGSLPLYTSVIQTMMQRVKQGIDKTMVHAQFITLLSHPAGVLNPTGLLLPLQFTFEPYAFPSFQQHANPSSHRFPISTSTTPDLAVFMASLNTNLDICTHTVLMYLKAVLDLLLGHPNLRKIIRHWERRIVLGGSLSPLLKDTLSQLAHHTFVDQDYHCVRLSHLEQHEQSSDQTGIAQDNGFGFAPMDNSPWSRLKQLQDQLAAVTTPSTPYNASQEPSSPGFLGVPGTPTPRQLRQEYHLLMKHQMEHRATGPYTENCEYSHEQRTWLAEESTTPSLLEPYVLPPHSIPPINTPPVVSMATTDSDTLTLVPTPTPPLELSIAVDNRRLTRLRGEPVKSLVLERTLKKKTKWMGGRRNTQRQSFGSHPSPTLGWQHHHPTATTPGGGYGGLPPHNNTRRITFNPAFSSEYASIYPSPFEQTPIFPDGQPGEMNTRNLPSPPANGRQPRISSTSDDVGRNAQASSSPGALSETTTDHRVLNFSPVVHRRKYTTSGHDAGESRDVVTDDMYTDSDALRSGYLTPRRPPTRQTHHRGGERQSAMKAALINFVSPNRRRSPMDAPSQHSQRRDTTSLHDMSYSRVSSLFNNKAIRWHLLSQLSRRRQPTPAALQPQPQPPSSPEYGGDDYDGHAHPPGDYPALSVPVPSSRQLKQAEACFIHSHIQHVMNMESPQQDYIPLFPPLPVSYASYKKGMLTPTRAMTAEQADAMSTHYLSPRFAEDLRASLIILRHQRLTYLHAKRILQAGIPLCPPVNPCCAEARHEDSAEPTSNSVSSKRPRKYPQLYGGMSANGTIYETPPDWPYGSAADGQPLYQNHPRVQLPRGWATLPIPADDHPDYSSDIIMRTITGLIPVLQTLFELPDVSCHSVIYHYSRQHRSLLSEASRGSASLFSQLNTTLGIGIGSPQSMMNTTTTTRISDDLRHNAAPKDTHALTLTLLPRLSSVLTPIYKPIRAVYHNLPLATHDFFARAVYWTRQRGIPVVVLACLVYWLLSSFGSGVSG